MSSSSSSTALPRKMCIRDRGKNGVLIYQYGGDFNPYDPSDTNFCDNGLVSTHSIPNPHADEVSFFYQNIWVTPVSYTHLDVYKRQVWNGKRANR